MDNRKLKQPKKYAHSSLDHKEEKDNSKNNDNERGNDELLFERKTKQIQKLQDRKVIRKKN